jgi:pimeloyl-ACP methyl ester carboxylesterase
MRKRLVITGLPCRPETWERFLGPETEQRVISMREILDSTESSDPRELSRYVTEQIALEKPTSIVCHGMGVPLTLLALMRLKRKGIELDTRLTVFNGPFRNVSLKRARHPWRMQFQPIKTVLREVERNGGDIDPELLPYASRIRQLFRLLILHRLAEKMTSVVGLDFLDAFPKRAGLKMPVQIIASPNDPYLPFETMQKLREDLQPDRYVEVEYGHFPYSGPAIQLAGLVQSFEAIA